jgi:hypothetical protein
MGRGYSACGIALSTFSAQGVFSVWALQHHAAIAAISNKILFIII